MEAVIHSTNKHLFIRVFYNSGIVRTGDTVMVKETEGQKYR